MGLRISKHEVLNGEGNPLEFKDISNIGSNFINSIIDIICYQPTHARYVKILK